MRVRVRGQRAVRARLPARPSPAVVDAASVPRGHRPRPPLHRLRHRRRAVYLRLRTHLRQPVDDVALHPLLLDHHAGQSHVQHLVRHAHRAEPILGRVSAARHRARVDGREDGRLPHQRRRRRRHLQPASLLRVPHRDERRRQRDVRRRAHRLRVDVLV